MLSNRQNDSIYRIHSYCLEWGFQETCSQSGASKVCFERLRYMKTRFDKRTQGVVTEQMLWRHDSPAFGL